MIASWLCAQIWTHDPDRPPSWLLGSCSIGFADITIHVQGSLSLLSCVGLCCIPAMYVHAYYKFPRSDLSRSFHHSCILIGIFYHSLLSGYSGNGYFCSDINECEVNNGGCYPSVQCLNTAGSRSCGPCPIGEKTGWGIRFSEVFWSNVSLLIIFRLHWQWNYVHTIWYVFCEQWWLFSFGKLSAEFCCR